MTGVGRQPFLVFGRDDENDHSEGCWWPLFVDDGPQLAENAEAAIAVIWERVRLAGETVWVDFAAVPAMDWTTARFDGKSA